MTLATIDIVLLAIVLLFIIGGWVYGFIKTLGNLVGLVGGIILASFALSWLEERFAISGRPILAIVFFLFVLLLVSGIIGWLTGIIEGLYKVLTIIPFLKTFNRLLGALLGIVEGLLVLLAIQFFAETYFAETSVGASLLSSKIMSMIAFAKGIVSWLFIL